MPFWLRLVATYVVIAIVLIVAFGADWETGVSLLILAGGIIPAIIRHSPKLSLLFQRLWYYITNKETTWELALQFRGGIAPTRVATLIETLRQADAEGTTVLQATGDRWLIRYHRIFTLEFVLCEDEATPADQYQPSGEVQRVDVSLFEQQVGFRRSKALLEQSLIPLIEQIRNGLQPDSTSYALRVQFVGANPFLSTYLQQIKPELVRDFQFEFTMPASEPGDYVRVDRSKMIVSSRSIESFRRAALAGLTFSAPAK